MRHSEFSCHGASQLKRATCKCVTRPITDVRLQWTTNLALSRVYFRYVGRRSMASPRLFLTSNIKIGNHLYEWLGKLGTLFGQSHFARRVRPGAEYAKSRIVKAIDRRRGAACMRLQSPAAIGKILPGAAACQRRYLPARQRCVGLRRSGLGQYCLTTDSLWLLVAGHCRPSGSGASRRVSTGDDARESCRPRVRPS